jgi:hypothetical protein
MRAQGGRRGGEVPIAALGLGEPQRGLVHRAGKQVDEGFHRLPGDRRVVDQAGQHVLEVLHRGCGIKLTPDPQPSTAGASMSMICWTCGSVLAFRNVAQPATSWFHGLRSAAASATLSPTFLVNLLEHGPEEPLLAAKVMIEGPFVTPARPATSATLTRA